MLTIILITILIIGVTLLFTLVVCSYVDWVRALKLVNASSEKLIDLQCDRIEALEDLIESNKGLITIQNSYIDKLEGKDRATDGYVRALEDEVELLRTVSSVGPL